ncbi:hypothetical protein DW322_13305 [Rhodococcus rhodnii]|uniref:Uncharacterized protein n=1 Tax=Rhodococcus rhodnii TaxID=38312 RepID=A0A6P2CE36_9NOCA|nr:hypothetical protein DW322_13305 [Rhodococcus rhodnii]
MICAPPRRAVTSGRRSRSSRAREWTPRSSYAPCRDGTDPPDPPAHGPPAHGPPAHGPPAHGPPAHGPLAHGSLGHVRGRERRRRGDGGAPVRG